MAENERSGLDYAPGRNGASPTPIKDEAPTQTTAPPLPQPGGARYAQIVGWGYHVPSKVITNHDLEQIVDTSDEWIRTRTGIEERRVAADPNETTASLAGRASKALDVADVHPASRPDHLLDQFARIHFSRHSERGAGRHRRGQRRRLDLTRPAPASSMGCDGAHISWRATPNTCL